MKNRTILLVEDNPDDVKLTIRALTKNKIANDVIVARDGEEALKVLENASPLPAFVLLDLKLPKLDGLEVLKKIRAEERWQLLPVVVLTSSQEQQDLIESYGRGANSYIRKPVDFEQFLEVVKQLGMYWLILNEAPPIGGAGS